MPGPVGKQPKYILQKTTHPDPYIWPYTYRISEKRDSVYILVYDLVYETNCEHTANEKFDALVREYLKENPPGPTVTTLRKLDF